MFWDSKHSLIRSHLILDLTHTAGLGCLMRGMKWIPGEGKCVDIISSCEWRVDYAGNTLKTSPELTWWDENGSISPKRMLEDCIEYCSAVPGAKFFTWQRSWTQGGWHRMHVCHCKSSDAGRREEADHHYSCRIN